MSRAVALGDDAAWVDVTRAMPAFQDQEGLLEYFPTQEQGSEVLTAYVASLAHAAGRTLPADVLDGMLGALGRFVDGTLRRESRMADLPLRRLAALEALARHGKATAAQVATIEATPALWPTSALLDWWSILSRVPEVPDRAARVADAEGQLRARLDLTGTMLRFSSATPDDLWWLMTGPASNAARLVLLAAESDAGRDTGRNVWGDDLPRLVRGTLALQRAGHWGTTTANAWGVLALERAGRVLEPAPVTGTTTAMLDTQRDELTWTDHPIGGTLELAWPSRPRRAHRRARRDGRTLGHGGDPRRRAAARTARQRLPRHQAHRAARGGGAWHVAQRRPPAGPARGRSPERHELGRDRRPRPDRRVAPGR